MLGDHGTPAASVVSPGLRDPRGAAGGRGRVGRVRTVLIGGAIIALGLGASAFLAAEWRSSAQVANRKAFDSTVDDLSSALGQKLTANVVLTRTIRARAAMGTQDDETDFLRWYAELQRGAPFRPDVLATLIEMVPASGLSAFRRQAEDDPALRGLPAARFRVVPAGVRPFYCLTRAIVGSGAASLYPGLVDYCAPAAAGSAPSPYRALVRTATDTGSFIVTTLPPAHGRTLVAISEAVYRGGAPLATVSDRRAAFTGFIGTTFDAPGLIGSVLAGHRLPDACALPPQPRWLSRADRPRRRQPGEPLFRLLERRDLGEGWLLKAKGTAADPISADATGPRPLVLGLLVTLLVFLLYRVLTGSRQRAWGLVGEKTDELGIPRAARPADGPAEPDPGARPRRADARARAPPGCAGDRAVRRHRRLQADQRPLRPPGRRRGPAPGRRRG